jgi:hypothetical protein
LSFTDLLDIREAIDNNSILDQVKDLDRLREIQQAASFLDNMQVDNNSLITLGIEGKNEVAITLITETAQPIADSIDLVKQIDYNNVVISQRQIEDQGYFTTSYKGVFMASNSQLIIESLIRRDVEDYVFDRSFERVYERTHDNNLHLYINAASRDWFKNYLLNNPWTDRQNHGDWYQLEIDQRPDMLQMDGLLVYKDSIKQQHSLYNNLAAGENQASRLAPAIGASLTSITYSDAAQLRDNLRTYHNRLPNIPVTVNNILDNSDEIILVEMEASAVAFHLKPYEKLFLDLDSLSTAKNTYREQTIYEIEIAINFTSLQPLVPFGKMQLITILDDFLVIAESQEVLESLISNYLNGTTISQQTWFKKSQERLSTSSSLLRISEVSNYKDTELSISDNDESILEKIDNKTYPVIISQYVHEDEYAHYRLLVPQYNLTDDQPLVAQIATYQPSQPIIAGPFLFPNHTNNSYDVALQEEDNQLNLVSATGEVYWSKQLEEPIIGKIHAVDTYRNGRQQLLFATSKKVYLLDREGNDVESYPYNVKETVTQPLSVFDYDDNRKYRILITIGEKLTMLDITGKQVKGFKYKTDGIINTSPQHFRRGNKDYIAFMLEGGKLKLLDRTGNIRTEIKQTFNTSSPLYFHDNLIHFTTDQGKMFQVNPTSGKVRTTNTSVDDDMTVVFTDNSQVIQNGNQLQINGKQTTLPYGTYTAASIFKINQKDFITTVDIGENKVYVLDERGTILPFFPVYGKETSVLAAGDKRYLVTMDDKDVIIYQW